MVFWTYIIIKSVTTIHNIDERPALREIWDMYHNATFFFSWHYNSLWVLACSTIFFHAYLSIAILLKFWIFIFPRSPTTLSSHLNLSVPALLTANVLHSVTLFTVLSLSILTICPIHLILCAFIYLTVSACLIRKPISSLVLILQPQSWFLLCCTSSSLLSFQILLTVVQVRLLVPRFRIHKWLLVVSHFYRCVIAITQNAK